ncbi:VC0807 family protein [Nocardia brasiliensis]|uniref:VC0807 family protein n=1 Tax=Nocardia brasiliensis TaxID=37326 RepID=UPI002456AD27|nr:VC0807 family protein [Nocardia brasiliensis]
MSLLINAVMPIAVFYGLRAAGVDQWMALMLGMVAPAAKAVHSAITNRRIEMLPGLIMTVLLLSVALSFLTGSPRTLLARDGWITAMAGLWILLTLPRTPYYLYALRTFTGGTLHERINAAWYHILPFRRVVHVCTMIWGLALLLDAASTVALAYTMPVDSVPLIGSLKLVALIILAEVISQVTFRCKGIPLLPHEPSDNPDQDGR